MDWVYRIFDRRTILVKAKNADINKIAAVDLATNLPLSVDVSSESILQRLEIDKAYFSAIKVYTAQDITGVATEFIEFFTVVDVDQSMEDFIKAYWLYPTLIRFLLTEAEPT